MKPSIISFDGMGRPSPKHLATGHVAILVQGGKKEVVRVELLPADHYGPQLHHATNQAELTDDLERFWRTLDVSELTDDRHWTIDCPGAIAQKATFEENA